MKRDAAEILKEALALSNEARAALAESLLDSLDTDVDERLQPAQHQSRTEHERVARAMFPRPLSIVPPRLARVGVKLEW
jgi:hypothetical protein